MSQAVTNPAVIMNNEPWFIVPNSFKSTEGFGEQNVRSQSAGGGAIDTVFSDNAETKLSKFSFELFPTKENIELARGVKANLDVNAAQVIDSASGYNRSFNSVSLTNDYEVELGADTTMTLEFMGLPAV